MKNSKKNIDKFQNMGYNKKAKGGDGMKEVIDRIRQIMVAKGIKQKFVAEQIGFTEQEFSNMMNGRRVLRIDDVKPICDVLGVLPNDIFYKNEE